MLELQDQAAVLVVHGCQRKEVLERSELQNKTNMRGFNAMVETWMVYTEEESPLKHPVKSLASHFPENYH